MDWRSPEAADAASQVTQFRVVPPIAELGPRKVSDLAHLEQGDLDDMGMTPYERADVRISVG